MALSLLGEDQDGLRHDSDLIGDPPPMWPSLARSSTASEPSSAVGLKPLDQRLVGALGRTVTIEPG